MTATPATPLAVPETETIANLLAQIVRPAQGVISTSNDTHVADVVKPIVVPPPPQIGMVPLPIGVLTVADLFALINWQNRPENAKPLPAVEPPPPPGVEHTVEAMLSQFGWE